MGIFVDISDVNKCVGCGTTKELKRTKDGNYTCMKCLEDLREAAGYYDEEED